jgi:NADH:ubiquinone oxidoreductase subunit 6 (subunit J)
MPHGDFHPILFVVVAVWVLVCGIGVVTFSNIVHSAMSMVLCFLGVAAVFVLLNSGLLAVIQILVYVGAISVVLLFAIMLTEQHRAGRAFFFNRQSAFALPLTVAAAVVITVVLVTSKLPPNGSHSHNVSLLGIANGLFNAYVFPFELVSFVLLAAMIGAIALARKEGDE